MKARHNPTFAEERQIAHRIELRLLGSAKVLMREFNVSRSVINRITRECKKHLQQLQEAKCISEQSEGAAESRSYPEVP